MGLDPGLQHTGWGMIDQDGSRLSFVAAARELDRGDAALGGAAGGAPCRAATRSSTSTSRSTAAVEETFVNKNPTSTLKLGLARGVALLTPALHKLEVSEYPANLVKKSVVGAGHAGKEQVQMMVRVLLPALERRHRPTPPMRWPSPSATRITALPCSTWGAKDFREAAAVIGKLSGTLDSVSDGMRHRRCERRRLCGACQPQDPRRASAPRAPRSAC